MSCNHHPTLPVVGHLLPEEEDLEGAGTLAAEA